MRSRYHAITLAMAVISFSAAAYGELLNGDIWLNPEVGGAGPLYVAGNPSPNWLTLDSAAAPNLVSEILGVPGFPQFTGTVESNVYFVNGEDASDGLGFAYRITLAPTSRGRLARATLSSLEWGGWRITEAGATGDGVSSPIAGGWTDGDPLEIARGSLGNPLWQFNTGFSGTELNGGNFSAIVWFETNATAYRNSVIGLLDGGTTGQAVVYGPIPEPASVALIAIGSAIIARRRRNAT